MRLALFENAFEKVSVGKVLLSLAMLQKIHKVSLIFLAVFS